MFSSKTVTSARWAIAQARAQRARLKASIGRGRSSRSDRQVQELLAEGEQKLAVLWARVNCLGSAVLRYIDSHYKGYSNG